MLSKEEYRIAHYEGEKIILCERLDMLGGIEEDLLQGVTFAYKCPPEKQSATKWKKMFEDFTKRQFCVLSSYAYSTRAVFTARYRCVHKRSYKSRRKAPASKRDFGCEAGMNVFVRFPESRRSKRPTFGGYNLRVKGVRHPHNHSHDVALKYRRVSDTTKAMLLELYDQHYTPHEAMEFLKLWLLEQHGDDYLTEASDRAVLPEKAYVTRVYYETYRYRYGNMSRKQVLQVHKEARLKRLGSEPPASEPTPAPSTSVQPSPHAADEPDKDHAGDEPEKDHAGDDFMDSFDEPVVELPAGWMGAAEVCYDDVPPVTTETEVGYGSTAQTAAVQLHQVAAAGGGDVAATPTTHATPGVEHRPADTPEHVIVCYMDEDPAEPVLLVDSTDDVTSASLDPAAGAAEGILVDTAGIDPHVSFAGEAVIEGMSATGPAGLLTTVSGAGFSATDLGGAGCSPADLSAALPPPPPPLVAAPSAAVAAAAANAASAAAGPSAETVAREVTRWAADVCRQLTADGDDQWRDAAATFVQNWELLPTPVRLTSLRQFGRVSGLGRPPGGARAQTQARPTETVATQTGREESEQETKVKLDTSSERSEGDDLYSRSLCVLRSGRESPSAVNWVWNGSELTAQPAAAASGARPPSPPSSPTVRPSLDRQSTEIATSLTITDVRSASAVTPSQP